MNDAGSVDDALLIGLAIVLAVFLVLIAVNAGSVH